MINNNSPSSSCRPSLLAATTDHYDTAAAHALLHIQNQYRVLNSSSNSNNISSSTENSSAQSNNNCLLSTTSTRKPSVSKKSKFRRKRSSSSHSTGDENSLQLPERPKRPLSAYIFYVQRNFSQMKADMIANGSLDPEKSPLVQVGKRVANNFSNLSPEEKQPYEKLSRQDRERHRQEMEQWTAFVRELKSHPLATYEPHTIPHDPVHSSLTLSIRHAPGEECDGGPVFPSQQPRRRRPMTAYNLFMKEMYEPIAHEHPDASGSTMTKHIAKAWQALSEKDRNLWESRAALLKADFDPYQPKPLRKPPMSKRAPASSAMSRDALDTLACAAAITGAQLNQLPHDPLHQVRSGDLDTRPPGPIDWYGSEQFSVHSSAVSAEMPSGDLVADLGSHWQTLWSPRHHGANDISSCSTFFGLDDTPVNFGGPEPPLLP